MLLKQKDAADAYAKMQYHSQGRISRLLLVYEIILKAARQGKIDIVAKGLILLTRSLNREYEPSIADSFLKVYQNCFTYLQEGETEKVVFAITRLKESWKEAAKKLPE